MAKGQITIIVIGIFTIMLIFVGSAILLSNIGSTNESIDDINITDNTTDYSFGENLTGSSRKELLEKIKDPNIAPDELSQEYAQDLLQNLIHILFQKINFS